MRPLTINVDSDGVIYDFNQAFQRIHPGVVMDESQWDLGLHRDEFLSLFEESILSGVFRIGEPIPGAIEGIMSLLEDGHKVRIVTSKLISTGTEVGNYVTKVARADTLEWFFEWGLAPLDISFVGDSKQGLIADVVIDDKPTLEWVQRFAKMNVLFDQPWNQDVDVLKHMTNVHRCAGWDVVLERIKNEIGVAA